MIWNIVIFVFICLTIFSSTKLVYNVISGRIMLRNAKKNKQKIITCHSVVFKLRNYIGAIVFEIIYLVFWILFIRITKNDLLIIMSFVEIAALSINIIIHFTAIFAEKYAYLTYDGLIYYLGCFDFNDCRFAWEDKGEEELSDMLHVYKPKDDIPFTVKFTDELEYAHKITDRKV